MISPLDQLLTLYTLLRHQYVTREEVVAFRNKRLRDLIAHAYNNVPYYRKLLDRAGLGPGDIKTTDDLGKIPVTSKNDLRSLPEEEIVARGVNPKNLVVRRTSGSSGEPLIIRRTWFEERLLGTIILRSRQDFGVRMTDTTASIGLVRPILLKDRLTPTHFLQALGLYRRVGISCLLPPDRILSKLERTRPDALAGFPGVISHLARVICNEGRFSITPRIVMVGGEVLTPLMRTQISKAFSAPVFETYGSHEFNQIARQCKETGELHVCDDSVILEVVKDGRPVEIGERGEVVCTGLHSFAMPFIRYRLGDIVTKGLEICRCGQPFSTISTVQGRMLDYFSLPGGRMVHPYEIIRIIVSDIAPWVSQYQLIQESVDRITCLVVPSANPTPSQVAVVEDSATKLLGPGVEFRIVLVLEIQFDSNGKFRVARSMVKSDYDEIDWNHPEKVSP
ncbi:MAG TPA: hypothetical protein VNN20_09210 [Thermodesulfobacteriota bacterium]|nr:hypothetical protein [Thermodesulfobacteriota bacterium]